MELFAAVPTARIAEWDVLKDVPWLGLKLFGNSLHAYLLTALSFLSLWAILHLARKYVVSRFARTAGASDARIFAHGLVHKVWPSLLPLVAGYVSVKRLSLPPTLVRGMHLVVVLLLTIQVVILAGDLINFVINRWRLKSGKDDPVVVSTTNNMTTFAKIVLWALGTVFFLNNMGVDVSTFIAGLGIGGVAIALAAQAILGDTFSSFAIALDKPFEVGDFINVDNLQGVVEHIGLKTTRVRGLGGELLVFANSDLTKSRIRNFKRMTQRRASLKLKIHPQIPLTRLKSVPSLLEEAVRAQPETRFERAHFEGFGDDCYIFEVVYYVLRPDYGLHMDIQQAILYDVYDAFAQAGIAFAFGAPPAIPLAVPAGDKNPEPPEEKR